MHRGVGVRRCADAAAADALGVEDAGEEPLAPLRRSASHGHADDTRTQPTTAVRWRGSRAPRGRPRSGRRGLGRRQSELRRDSADCARAPRRRREREAESASTTLVLVRRRDLRRRAPTPHEVAASVRPRRRPAPRSERADADEADRPSRSGAADRAPRSSSTTCFHPRRVRNRWSPLATSSRAVLERDAIGRLARRTSARAPRSSRTDGTGPRRACRRSRRPRADRRAARVRAVGEQDRRVRREAVDAGMACTPGTG